MFDAWFYALIRIHDRGILFFPFHPCKFFRFFESADSPTGCYTYGMPYIIVGLGNPGKEYEGTRHNSGRIILDLIRREFEGGDFEFDKKLNAAPLNPVRIPDSWVSGPC